uniref:Uncharacterized protein n=1 Tax=Anguilla anguilla TaxID=7936 RepID=A0A0E9UZX1_ANGAN
MRFNYIPRLTEKETVSRFTMFVAIDFNLSYELKCSPSPYDK